MRSWVGIFACAVVVALSQDGCARPDRGSPCLKAGERNLALMRNHPKARELEFLLGTTGPFDVSLCERTPPTAEQFACMDRASSFEEHCACVPSLVEERMAEAGTDRLGGGAIERPGEHAAHPTARARHPGVDADCYEDALTCDRNRVADAERAADLLLETLATAGWPLGCFTVQYISGDTGEDDAISVAVSGPKGGGAARCREDPPRRAALADVARTAKTIRRVLGQRAELVRGVDLLQVTDGVDAEIQLHLR